MVDTVQGDVLMYFVLNSEDPSAAIAAESGSDVIPASDKLANDFKPGKYFEAEGFTFTIALDDSEGAEDDAETREKKRKGLLDTRSYSRWRALNNGIKPNPPYQAKPGDIAITRLVDSSSPLLAQHCLNSETFKKAVLVKRSRVGSTGIMTGIVRMDFNDVQIRSLEWQDSEAVKETLKFRFGKVALKYIKRSPDGSTASQWSSIWDLKQNG